MTSRSARSGAESTIAMKGAGYYSARTKGAKDVIDNAAPLVLDVIARMDIAADAPAAFSVADFGAADGGTSLELMGLIVGAVRARALRRPVTLTYTDLPRNDYSALFRNTQGMSNAGTFLRPYDDLYVFASGTSFYQQILPDAALDLGFSATAMHWLSGAPGVISGHVHAVGARGAEREAFAARGAQEWEAILLHRARELRPGGKLVLVNFGIDEEGRYLGNTVGANMFDIFNELWAALIADRIITAEEYRNTNFPQFYKTVAEFAAPFDDADGPVRAAGLALEHIETRVVSCPYAAEFRANGDLDAFAPAYIGTLRSWSETVFKNGLDAARPAEERQAIVDRFYDSYERRVRDEPEAHAMDYVHIYMVIGKADSSPSRG